MNCHLYLRKGILYVPTMGKMDEGFYRGVEPVAVISVSNSEGVRECLRAAVIRGNPAVPMLPRRKIPPPVLLKYAGVKSWSAFEKGMLAWTVKKQDGAFRIAGQIKNPDRMWRDDPDQLVNFPPGASVDEVVDRMIAILHDTVRKVS
ncbi:MAG TPA: hypothetical protein VN938_07340 [Xanthobacteraceae bacterium]|jgi:hypothetical protein|nr:hypothetical protein [Xanthobacteraceae bacterium]